MADTGSPQELGGGNKERENLDRLLKIFNGGTGVNLGVSIRNQIHVRSFISKESAVNL